MSDPLPRVESSPTVLDRLIEATPATLQSGTRVTKRSTPFWELRQKKSAVAAAPAAHTPLAHRLSAATVTATFGALAAVAVALLASSQPTFSLEQGTISIVPWLEILLPNFLAIAELTAFCALGTLVAPLAFVALLVCDARRVALAYGTLALAIPFLLPSPYTNGTGPMAQALVIYIAYWKLLDVLCGTAPAAVLATPRNTLVHFAFLLEYRVAKEAKEAGEKESPAAAEGLAATPSTEEVMKADAEPTTPPSLPLAARLLPRALSKWLPTNDGLHRVEVAQDDELLRTALELARDVVALCLIGSLRLHAAPLWCPRAIAAAAYGYSSVWAVYLNLKLATSSNGLGLLLLGYRPQVAFRSPLTSSTSPTDFWSRRWNMIVRGLFHRTVFTPLRNRGVPPQYAALGAFVISGLFHEYAFLPCTGLPTLGCELAFFLVQAVVCTLELALKGTGASRALKERCPGWLKVVGTSCLLVPWSPLFMAPLTHGPNGGTLDAMLANIVRVRVLCY